MEYTTEIRKVAFVGDCVPRKCGIATFSWDICRSVAAQYPTTECIVAAVEDVDRAYEYPPEVRFQFAEQDLPSYRRAADFLNFSNVDVVSLQHEFGIYGGPAGSYILALLRDLHIPVVTTLHTVLREPSSLQRRVIRQLAELSSQVVVMSERGKEFLQDIYDVPQHEISVIPHGIPDMPFVDPNFYKDQFDVEGKYVVLTFGLLSPNKGIEYMLRALPRIVETFPDLVYIVLGVTHPNLLRDEGETYRLYLEHLAQDLGIEKNVVFYNRFVELNELMEFIAAADLYVTPYLNPAQITSGTLAYAFGCGKAVVSTPYWHAEELLASGRGVLVPFRDATALSDAVLQLLRDEPGRHAMRKRAYLLGREMVWSSVAQTYMGAFQKARRSRIGVPVRSLVVRTLDRRAPNLPALKLDHLLRMTDSTGLFQHAVYSIPDFKEGYCTDDNARALVLCTLLEELGQDTPLLHEAASTYAAFLNFAYDPERNRFRNFMGFDRRWLEEVGSDDSFGRSIWALGSCIGRSERHAFRYWATQLFDKAVPACIETDSPRSWALSLIGIHEYFRRFSGDRRVDQIRDELTARLVHLFNESADDGWPWFEGIVAYDNARLSHALILSGRWGQMHQAFDIGLRSLRWLVSIQKTSQGWFRPIGSNGFFRRQDKQAEFDQQPLEASAMVSACIEAFRSTGDEFWLQEARTAMAWFFGRNDLGQSLYDSTTGGCYDGLQQDRLNQNQGAESTLALLLALTEMSMLENSLAAFREPAAAGEGEMTPRDVSTAHVEKENGVLS